MEASAQHNTLEIIQNYVQDPAIENQAPLKTIKMEDISSSTTSSPSLHNTPKANSTTKSSESKPAKKRKSWGQVLPEPKTNLPPRKRAKTQDEKEQRRIERVKRNRLAAHNSRERKRQEVDHLQKRNDLLEAHVVLMQRTIDAYKAQFPDAQVPSVPVLPQMEKINFDNVDSPSTTYNDNFASEPSPRQPQQPRQPLQPIYNNHYMAEMSTPAPFSSPETLLSGFDSPVDTAPSTPVSVGLFQPLNLGGNENYGKLSLGNQFEHSFQLDLDDGNAFQDFALYPEDTNSFRDTNSFFDESFDGSANRESVPGGDSSNALELFDADDLFDLQAGIGASNGCDAPSIAV